MAEGRMLKRVIATSPRVAALKNDTHRLIYTWLLPFLDVEGRIEADPRIIKGSIMPLLDHVTPRVISAALLDMAQNNLIVLYEVMGNKYLELLRFHKHQILREGREKKSDIPPPANSVATPSEPPHNSVATPSEPPDKISLKEDKIREGKFKRARARHPLPFDFQISERVQKWAGEKKINHLPEHLEAFKSKCRAHNYQYVDWDAAFQEAIRANWAKIENAAGVGAKPSAQHDPFTTCPQCKREVLKSDIEGNGCIKCARAPTNDVVTQLTQGMG